MTDSLDRARALLATAPVVDGHNDLAYKTRELGWYDFDRFDLGDSCPDLHTDIPRLRAGGVGGQFWSVYVPSHLAGDNAVAATLEQIDAVRAVAARWPDTFELVGTADEAAAAMSAGRIASLLGAEGGYSIDCSLGALRMLYALGVRYMTLTHNDNVPWADSATDEPGVGGLSRFGREVVLEMNRMGMLVDCSHVAASTMRAALGVTEAPILFSHSSARAVCDVPRNVPDDVLERLPGNGGACLVTFVPSFVSTARAEWTATMRERADANGVDRTDREAVAAFTDRYQAANPPPRVTVAMVADHVDHVREVAGVDHVGLGGDYDGVPDQPEGLEDVSGYPRLIAELIDRGWPEADLAKLTGGNALRVLRDAEAVARACLRGPSTARFEHLDQLG